MVDLPLLSAPSFTTATSEVGHPSANMTRATGAHMSAEQAKTVLKPVQDPFTSYYDARGRGGLYRTAERNWAGGR